MPMQTKKSIVVVAGIVPLTLLLGACQQQTTSQPDQTAVTQQQARHSDQAAVTEQQVSHSDQATVAQQMLSADVTDWDGYYHGVVPCASCSGIDTWLHLNKAGEGRYFELIEIYRGQDEQTFKVDGTLAWDSKGNTITLKADGEARQLLLQGDSAMLVQPNYQGPLPHPDYQLRKMSHYAGNGEQLLVDRGQVSGTAQHLLHFPALMNFQFATESGHRSLTADVTLDCPQQRYRFDKVAYYHERFAGGTLQESGRNPADDWQPLADQDDVLSQLASDLCGSGE